MANIIDDFTKEYLKKDLPPVKVGDLVKVYQKIPAEEKKKGSKQGEAKERIQVFEGVVLAKKHGKGINGSFTVRKIIDGVGVEKVFPWHLSTLLDFFTYYKTTQCYNNF